MDENNPLRNFTILGRLWIIACIVIGTHAFVYCVTEHLPAMPPGSYPIFIFLVPVGLATLCLYGLGYAILRLIGFQLRRPPKNDPPD